MEREIVSLWQIFKRIFNFLTPLTFGNHIQMAIFGKVDDPIPTHTLLATPVGADGIDISKYIYHDFQIFAMQNKRE